MFRQSFWAQGNGAIVMAAISALDIAFWDIKAKAANLPLYKLLGGKHRPAVRCYASQLQFGWGVSSFNPQKGASGEPAYYAEMAQRAAAQHCQQLKKSGGGMPPTLQPCGLPLPPMQGLCPRNAPAISS